MRSLPAVAATMCALAIPAGEIREWFSTRPFILTVGNAGGIKLELNGRAVPSLGPSGVVVPRLVLPTESP